MYNYNLGLNVSEKKFFTMVKIEYSRFAFSLKINLSLSILVKLFMAGPSKVVHFSLHKYLYFNQYFYFSVSNCEILLDLKIEK